VGLCLDGDFDLAIDYCKTDCIPSCYKYYGLGLFGIGEYASQCIDLTCNLHRWDELGDRLGVAITRLPFFQGERASRFTSQKDVKDSLLASASCYPLAPLVKRQGVWCIDGGFSDFQPINDEGTITVSPFYFSNADIKPSRYVPVWWSLLPPKDPPTIEWLYALGQEDGATYIKQIDAAMTELALMTTELSNGKDNVNANDNDNKDDRGPEKKDTESMAFIVRQQARRRLKEGHHSYDIRRRVSFERFLGYDVDTTSHYSYIIWFIDWGLLLALMGFWKPLALISIYTELWLQLTIHCTWAAVREVLQLLPMILLLLALFGPHLTLAYALTLFLIIQKLLTVGPAQPLPDQPHALWDLLVCITSANLLRRFWSVTLSQQELKCHDLLAERSFTYRVFRHII
jgi:hypothetical protein